MGPLIYWIVAFKILQNSNLFKYFVISILLHIYYISVFRECKISKFELFKFYFDSNKKALTQVADISKCNFCVQFNIYMCKYFHVFAIYYDSINSSCRLSVCGGVTICNYALLHYPMSSFPYCCKTKENLWQYKFSMYYIFLFLALLVPFLYINDLFHMHWMLGSTIEMKRKKG